MTDYEGTYVVWGPPGTGKTRRLATQVNAIFEKSRTPFGVTCENPVLVCSLTRTAATEIAGRDLPIDRKMVSTLHSHAYRSINSPELAEAHAEDWNARHPHLRLGGSHLDGDELAAELVPRDRTEGDLLYEI